MSQKGEFSLGSVSALWHSTGAESPPGAAGAASILQGQAVCPGNGSVWIVGHVSVEIS